jgi:hypothetical protein
VRRLAVPAILLALAACSRPAERRPFVLRVAVVGPLTRVDPRAAESSAAYATDLTYDAILYPGLDGRARSRVARSFERLGPSRYRLVLDPGVRFSDGAPLAFEDVARAVALWDVSARREGDAIVLESPTGALEAKLYYSAIYREAEGRVLGTGPFRVTEQTPWRVALERVRPAPGRIARVELLAFPSSRDTLSRTLRGETNGVALLSERQAEFLEGIPGLTVVRSPAPHARAVVFDEKRLPQAEWQALRAALPFGRIAPFACGAGAEPDPSLATVGGALPPGRPLAVVNRTFDTAPPLVGLAIRRALGPRGGALTRPDPAAIVAAGARLDADLTVRNVLVWPPVTLALVWGTGSPFNTTGYSNPAVDEAFARGDAEAAARELFRAAPFVVLCRGERIAAFDARIRNPSLGWWGVLDTLPEWEIEP